MQTAPKSETVRMPRPVEHLATGQLTSDGADVQLTRVLTDDWQHRLDPFLMLDATADLADDPRIREAYLGL